MKRIAALAIVAVGAVALAWVVVPLVTSSALITGRVADRLSALTGRVVTVEGDSSLSIYPHVAVSIGGVKIANPGGIEAGSFLTAERLTARLRLLPLLVGRAEFDVLELENPRIQLTVDAAGSENWRLDQGGVAARVAAPTAADGTETAAPGAIALGDIRIVNGTVIYDNQVTNRHEELSAVNLDVSWPSTDAVISGSGSLQWRAETVEFNAALTRPLELLGGTASPLRFSVGSTPIRVSFNGQAIRLDRYQLDGKATVTTPSMRRTIEWLGRPMGPGAILGAASAEGTMSWFGSTVAFSDAVFELDGNRAEGALTTELGGERPRVLGTLAFEALDLSPYIGAIRGGLVADGLWLVAPTALPVVDVLDADVRLSTGAVTLAGLRLGRAAAAVAIRDGTLAVDIGDTVFHRGNLNAHIDAAMEGETLVVQAHATLSAVAAGPALDDLAAIAALDGTATVSVDIGSRGRSWGELARAVAGNAAVEVANGSIVGFDAGELAERLSDPLAEPVAAGTGRTRFTKLATTLVVAEGSVATDDLALTAGDVRIALSGRGSIVTGLVDATATITVDNAGGAGREVPVTIAGTWREPVVAPVGASGPAPETPAPAPEPAPGTGNGG